MLRLHAPTSSNSYVVVPNIAAQAETLIQAKDRSLSFDSFIQAQQSDEHIERIVAVVAEYLAEGPWQSNAQRMLASLVKQISPIKVVRAASHLSQSILSHCPSHYYRVHCLFRSLVFLKVEGAPEEARQIAIDARSHKCLEAKCLSRLLLVQLVDQNFQPAFNTALSVALLVDSRNPTDQEEGLKCFRALVTKRYPLLLKHLESAREVSTQLFFGNDRKRAEIAFEFLAAVVQYADVEMVKTLDLYLFRAKNYPSRLSADVIEFSDRLLETLQSRGFTVAECLS